MKWNDLDWKLIDLEVSSLQRRIYRASLNNDLNTVHVLQDLLMDSWSGKLKAVRRVTQENRSLAEKKTAGVFFFHEKSVPPEKRIELAQNLILDGKSDNVRRVYIPKSGYDFSPLGIPTIKERSKQALAFMAMEPQWEARFEPNSYGFRPGRSCHDAIEAIFSAIAKKNKFVLDGDIRKCFDKFNHDYLIAKLDASSVIKKQVLSWLKAGILDDDQLFPSTEGTPQGVSPLLANIALHGMETLLKEYVAKRSVRNIGRISKMLELAVVRYADDFVIIHPEREVIETCRSLLVQWLSNAGLELHPEKTRIIPCLSDTNLKFHFDFLGFTVMQRFIGKYKVKKSRLALRRTFVTHIIPSAESIKKYKENLKECFRLNENAESLLNCLNPKIRGWTQYFKVGVSSETFGDIDAWLYKRFIIWAERKHPTRGRRWLVERYFRQINPERWIFGVHTGSEGSSKISQAFHRNTKIERHIKVQSSRSPYDGDWVYWTLRMSRYGQSAVPERVLFLVKRQKGKCAGCGLHFFPSEDTQVDHILARSKGGSDRYDNLQLMHIHCHQKKSGKDTSK